MRSEIGEVFVSSKFDVVALRVITMKGGGACELRVARGRKSCV